MEKNGLRRPDLEEKWPYLRGERLDKVSEQGTENIRLLFGSRCHKHAALRCHGERGGIHEKVKDFMRKSTISQQNICCKSYYHSFAQA